jgi:RND superfamily putative drug exporter
VIVSLLSIWAVPVRAVQSMAGGAVLVVAVAVLAAATLLPALLHIAGRRVDRGRIRLRRRRATVRPVGPSTFWTAWVARIMRRPLPWFLGGAAVLVVLTIPAFFMETKNTSLEQLPTTSDVRQGNELLTREITGPGQGRSGSLAVLVQPLDGRPALAAPARAAADELAAALARDPLVRQTAVEPAGQALVVRADLRVDPEGEAARDELVPRVREIVAGSSVSTLAQVDVGGVSAFAHDLDEEVGGDLIVVILLVVALAYVVLLVLLRSVLLPLKAVVLNLLSIGAAYGVIVAVFQWGWLDWTGYESLGAVNTLNPALILAITFGLSMDYEVFLLSRIRERYEAHGDNERAVAEGIASSARVITSAAAIMVAVFSAFVLTGVPTIKEIGVGLAVAIAVDATVTRLVLVPATMRLLGDWNWWLPSWLDRLLPHVAHETGRPAPAAVAAD